MPQPGIEAASRHTMGTIPADDVFTRLGTVHGVDIVPPKMFIYSKQWAVGPVGMGLTL